MQGFEFIRKNSKNIFFVAHRHKNQMLIWVSGFYFAVVRGIRTHLNAKGLELRLLQAFFAFIFF